MDFPNGYGFLQRLWTSSTAIDFFNGNGFLQRLWISPTDLYKSVRPRRAQKSIAANIIHLVKTIYKYIYIDV